MHETITVRQQQPVRVGDGLLVAGRIEEGECSRGKSGSHREVTVAADWARASSVRRCLLLVVPALAGPLEGRAGLHGSIDTRSIGFLLP